MPTRPRPQKPVRRVLRVHYKFRAVITKELRANSKKGALREARRRQAILRQLLEFERNPDPTIAEAVQTLNQVEHCEDAYRLSGNPMFVHLMPTSA
jgi:hypothetical protein